MAEFQGWLISESGSQIVLILFSALFPSKLINRSLFISLPLTRKETSRIDSIDCDNNCQ